MTASPAILFRMSISPIQKCTSGEVASISADLLNAVRASSVLPCDWRTRPLWYACRRCSRRRKRLGQELLGFRDIIRLIIEDPEGNIDLGQAFVVRERFFVRRDRLTLIV